ncbi:MAG: DUF3761 domain-containing protein [Patescibacteria group bacterium]
MKRLLVIVVFASALLFMGAGCPEQQYANSNYGTVKSPTVATSSPQQSVGATTVAPDDAVLSNDNHYTNSDGNTVHSPAYTTDNTVPAGATAQCRDGTYSFSQHRSGTCSGHHGVAKWL